jgi:hypothetical protein
MNYFILLTRQQNISNRHPRLSGIGRRNKLNSKKDTGQAGMTVLLYIIARLLKTALEKRLHPALIVSIYSLFLPAQVNHGSSFFRNQSQIDSAYLFCCLCVISLI